MSSRYSFELQIRKKGASAILLIQLQGVKKERKIKPTDTMICLQSIGIILKRQLMWAQLNTDSQGEDRRAGYLTWGNPVCQQSISKP